MAKNIAFLRQILIYNKIKRENSRNQYPSLIELKEYVENEMQKDLRKDKFAELTIKRDIKELRSQFKIIIIFNKAEKGYFIEENNINSFAETFFSSFDILSSLNSDERFPEFIIPQNRKSDGMVHISYLARCIEQKVYVDFDYFKYDSNQTDAKIVAPYALKQSRNRWYLLGIPENENQIKAYGLDRIQSLSKSQNKVVKKVSIQEINEIYSDCFAMFTTEKPAETVVLSFDKRDGNYIKSFPIHHSQRIEEKEERIIVSLHLKITLDFMMELMSRSWSVEIIKPKSLRKEFHKIYTEALQRNSWEILK